MPKKKKQKFTGIVYSTDPDYTYEEEGGGFEETLAPEDQRLRVEYDKKLKGGKKVTKVKGFEGTEEDLKALGKTLKLKCGCGGSAKEGIIILQGDFREKARKELEKLGYKVR